MLRSSIGNQQYHGKRLPTEFELVQRYKVSRQTVRRAYQELVTEGIIQRVPGRGTFASPRGQYVRSLGSLEDLLAQSEDTEMEVLKPLRRAARPQDGARVAFGPGPISEMTIRRSHHGLPFVVTVVSVPAAVGRLLNQVRFLKQAGAHRSTTILETLDGVLDRRIVLARQTITIARVPEDLAVLIDCRAKQPVLRIERLFLDSDVAPVELAVNYMNPERYQYRLELKRTQQ